jgi:hypothetical protein
MGHAPVELVSITLRNPVRELHKECTTTKCNHLLASYVQLVDFLIKQERVFVRLVVQEDLMMPKAKEIVRSASLGSLQTQLE